jgi:hypothetical protein
MVMFDAKYVSSGMILALFMAKEGYTALCIRLKGSFSGDCMS